MSFRKEEPMDLRNSLVYNPSELKKNMKIFLHLFTRETYEKFS
jgi:hypothetical protein